MRQKNGCYCISCLHSSRMANELKSQEGVCKDHVYCQVKMPKQYMNILKFNHEKTPSEYHLISMQTQNLNLKNIYMWQHSTRILYNKIKQAYSMWLFIIYTLFIWQQQKQRWFLQRWRPNEKIMYRPKKAHYRNIQQQEKGNVTSKKEIKYLRKTRTLPHIQTRI